MKRRRRTGRRCAVDPRLIYESVRPIVPWFSPQALLQARRPSSLERLERALVERLERICGWQLRRDD